MSGVVSEAPSRTGGAPQTFLPSDLSRFLGPIVEAPMPMPLAPFSGHRHRMSTCRILGHRPDTECHDIAADFVWDRFGMGGCGAGSTRADADLRAAVEAIERYSALIVSRSDVLVAAAGSLDDALDLATIPRFSDAEMERSPFMLERPDPDAPIRWFQGWSPTRRRRTWLPLVMTHLPGEIRSGERFWLPISTGVAAHTDQGKAIRGAISEVVERDVIATTWLAGLALPRIRLDEVATNTARDRLAACYGSRAPVLLFDGGIEFGLTTVYAVRRFGGGGDLTTVVACATNADPLEACCKAVSEVAAIEVSLGTAGNALGIPQSALDCREIDDGARFMGGEERAHAFDFLLETKSFRSLSELAERAAPFLSWGHRELADALGREGFDVFLADLTTDDVRDLGLHVVRAIVPRLMPYSCVTRGRYLATPRLYEVARRSGRPNFEEVDVNQYPQPFA